MHFHEGFENPLTYMDFEFLFIYLFFVLFGIPLQTPNPDKFSPRSYNSIVLHKES